MNSVYQWSLSEPSKLSI